MFEVTVSHNPETRIDSVIVNGVVITEMDCTNSSAHSIARALLEFKKAGKTSDIVEAALFAHQVDVNFSPYEFKRFLIGLHHKYSIGAEVSFDVRKFGKEDYMLVSILIPKGKENHPNIFHEDGLLTYLTMGNAPIGEEVQV